MASPEQLSWLKNMYESAQKAGHKWPGCAAAEAAAETGWGAHLPQSSNNVLGIKAFKGWTGPTVDANGTEQAPDGAWSGPELDAWCVFASPEECFAEQMKILAEPRYAAAMAANTPESYIVHECAVWSTGIQKGQTVLAIWQAHQDVLNP